MLDPEIVALFDGMRATNMPRVEDLPPPQARALFRMMCETAGGPLVEMAAVEEHHAAGPDGDIPLRLYRPHGVDETEAPLLIFYHGGGWVIGDLATHDNVCRHLAASGACLVASVDYRLAPEHPAPAAVDDALATFSWISDHAARLGADRTRLAIGGDSAGGNLAALAAIAARDDGRPLRAQILVYPSVDLRSGAEVYPSRVDNAEMPPLTASTVAYFRRHYLPDASLADDPRVSPMLVADKAGLAPALVITAEADLLRDEGRAYARALAAAGVPVLERDYPGMVHGFVNFGHLSAARDAYAAIGDELKRRLATA